MATQSIPEQDRRTKLQREVSDTSIPLDNDSDLFSDEGSEMDVDSSDDEADLNRFRQKGRQPPTTPFTPNISTGPLRAVPDHSVLPAQKKSPQNEEKSDSSSERSKLAGILSTATAKEPPSAQETKGSESSTAKSRLKTKLTKVTSEVEPTPFKKVHVDALESSPATDVSSAKRTSTPGMKEKRRERLPKLTDKTKRRVKLVAKKSKMAVKQNLVPTVVEDLTRCVIENGKYKFIRIKELNTSTSKKTGRDQYKSPPSRLNVIPRYKSSLHDSAEKEHGFITDATATSYLKGLGWVHNRRLNSFKLKGDSFSLHLSRKMLLKLMKDTRKRLEQNTKNHSDELIAGRIEEDLLVSMVQRTIDVAAMMEESGEYATDTLSHTEDKTKKSKKKKVPKSSKVTLGEKPKKTRSNISRSTKGNDSKKAPGQKFISVVKHFPRYYGNFEEELLTEDLLSYVRNRLPIVAKRPNMLAFKVENVPNDVHTTALKMNGREDLVEEAKNVIVKHTQKMISIQNSEKFLQYRNPVELYVKLDATRSFGFKMRKGEKSLWIYDTGNANECQLREIFPRVQKGGVITRMGPLKRSKMEVVDTIKAKNRLMNKAKSTYEASGREEDKWIVACLYLSQSEDLSKPKLDRLVVRKNGKMICNRDGTAYRGRFKNLFQARRLPSVSHGKSQRASAVMSKTVPRKRKVRNEIMSSQKVTSNDERNNEPGVSAKIPRKRKLGDNSPDEPSSKREKNSASYEHFKLKMKAVKEIEFKGTIRLTKVNSLMWSAHKQHFGEECNDNCKCISQLKLLTRDVFGQYIEYKRKQDPLWTFEENLYEPLGFAESFCDKYFHRVRELFPRASPQQILSKLVDLWRRGHQTQIIFNGKCSIHCPCSSSWELLFLPILKGGGERNNRLNSKQNTSIPRKLPRIETDSSAPINWINSEAIFKVWNYALGFFCITRNDQCVIESVDPKRKAIHAKHIEVGSIIEWFQVGKSTKQPLTSHGQLREIYNRLKIRGDKTTLKLFYKTPANSRKTDCHKDWSDMSSWIGRRNQAGWAGGATIGVTASNTSNNVANINGHVMVGRAGHSRREANDFNSSSEIPPAKALLHRESSLPLRAIKKIHYAARENSYAGYSQSKPDGSKVVKTISPTKAVQQPESSSSFLAKARKKIELNKRALPAPSILRKSKAQRKGNIEKSEKRVRIAEGQNKVQLIASRGAKKSNNPNAKEKLEEAALSGSLQKLVENLKHFGETELELHVLKDLEERLKNEIKHLKDDMGYLVKADKTRKEKDQENAVLERDLKKLEEKRVPLKIYARFCAVLGNTFECLVNEQRENDSGLDAQRFLLHEAKRHYADITKSVKLAIDWLTRFQSDAASKGFNICLDANIHFHGISLFHSAAFIGNSEIIDTLVKNGANLQKSRGDVGSALDVAIEMSKIAEHCRDFVELKKFVETKTKLELLQQRRI